MVIGPVIVDSSARVIPGRECGTCSLCCKVYNVPSIGHVAGKWCRHCKPGKGCTIHDALPEQCALFNCAWRIEPSIPDVWKPDQAKMVLTVSPFTGFIHVQVDPSTPTAWRRQPYYDQLRLWARNNLEKEIYILVFVNDKATLILPDQDVPIGTPKGTDRISVRKNHGPGFATYEVKITPGAPVSGIGT
jgi:hypothetical protein